MLTDDQIPSFGAKNELCYSARHFSALQFMEHERDGASIEVSGVRRRPTNQLRAACRGQPTCQTIHS